MATKGQSWDSECGQAPQCSFKCPVLPVGESQLGISHPGAGHLRGRGSKNNLYLPLEWERSHPRLLPTSRGAFLGLVLEVSIISLHSPRIS